MKCQSLFSEKSKKNISNFHQLKFLPRVVSLKLFYSGEFNFVDYYNFVS